ncbi:MAG: FIG215594: Membrane spanning protein [uncultured Nocardioidaceae bacterium]|uniref:FIG215594: Membrane spanning protein n=1 Tax=uncultured Nocardioidaceae bacterium TaxID=253824 RepID=A0A6J4LPK6_9ACTN|nr:MAG: FIG215594: Membrane spanning protein [uncultured Nocardioidaceae bacterium]
MDQPHAPHRPRAAWRLATPLIAVAAGVLLVTSAVTSRGTDLRPGRYDSLADLARQETQRVTELREDIEVLSAEVDELSAGLDNHAVERLQARAEALAGPAGLSAVRGPGLTVSLDDAPEEFRQAAGDQVSDAIVHQQDIQAVVNALWAGGAEAMTLQGQRVVSTTGIKCVGNTVILHGVPYSPPYVVRAVGDPATLQRSLDASRYIQAYLEAVEAYQLGWGVRSERRVTAPAYTGPVDLRHAQPVDPVEPGQRVARAS